MNLPIELNSIAKTFVSREQTVTAVDGVDLQIGRGELVALLGPNGAGKTTLLDIVLGFTEPTTGTATIFGNTPRQAVIQGKVSAMLQTGGPLRDLKVGELLRLVASLYQNGYPDLHPEASMDDAAQTAGVDHLSGRRFGKCSGGEQQRVRLALALLADPQLLILDEPTAGMDVSARRDFWAVMQTQAKRGRTIVFATHYLQEAEDFAERTILLAKGRVIADGSTESIRQQASSRLVRITIPELRTQNAKSLIETAGDHSVKTATRIPSSGDQRWTISSRAADDLARLVLNKLDGYDLEVESASLETAFVDLTDSPPTETHTNTGTSETVSDLVEEPA